MAVRDGELRCLQPGDQIVIISASEAMLLSGKDRGGWVGDMHDYCSHTLTVEQAVSVAYTNDKAETHVYVEENGWWWKAAFIAEVITKEEYEPIPFESLDSLLFGGA